MVSDILIMEFKFQNFKIREKYLDKKYLIKKAKDIFLYDIYDGRFYDLQRNSNILGHSYKKLTSLVKNDISSKWNISGNTVYHYRMKKIFEKLFSPDYHLSASFSLHEFILSLNNYSINNSYNLKFKGERFKLWLEEKCNIIKKDKENLQKNIIIYDMAEIFLRAEGDYNKFNDLVKNLKKEEITVFNYFWYPYLDLNIDNADIIILPEIYSGNFNFSLILFNKNMKNYNQLCIDVEYIPSLYIASSLKMYYLIRRIKTEKKINLKWNNFIQARRLFSYKDINEYENIIDNYFNKNIILSKDPPYYNYLPLVLQDYQVKYLLKIII